MKVGKMPARLHGKRKRNLDDVALAYQKCFQTVRVVLWAQANGEIVYDTVDVLVANDGREWHVAGEEVRR